MGSKIDRVFELTNIISSIFQKSCNLLIIKGIILIQKSQRNAAIRIILDISHPKQFKTKSNEKTTYNISRRSGFII